jgi:hypothetical protein
MSAAKCPTCGWTRRVTKDGLVIKHRFRDHQGYNQAEQCSGSGQRAGGVRMAVLPDDLRGGAGSDAQRGDR